MTGAARVIVLALIASALLGSRPASGQLLGLPTGPTLDVPGGVFTGPLSPLVTAPIASRSPEPRGLNPMAMLSDAGGLLGMLGGGGSATPEFDFTAPRAGPAGPRGSMLGLPADAAERSRGGLSVALNIMVLLTVLTLIPSLMLMTTCFVRILIVLGLLRQAIGAQSVPPAQVITALAMFMTMMVMTPTIERVWDEAIGPWQAGEVTDYEELWDRAKRPVRDFMFDQIEATGNWSSVYMLLNYQGVDTSSPQDLTRADVDTQTLAAGYMLSELKVAFLMGFRVYLPFLVIDMVIASILISMSMMMLPPVLVSLPFKLLLFVLVDGWTLVVGSLMESVVQDGGITRSSGQAAGQAIGAMLPMVLMLPLIGARTAGGGGDRPALLDTAGRRERR